jgi:hypothetical protein
MKSRYRYAIRGHGPDPGVFPFAVKIHLYKTCRHLFGDGFGRMGPHEL